MSNKYIIDYGMGYFHPKLGDTIVYMSAFCHFKNVVWRQKAKVKPAEPWLEIAPMYRGRYNLKIQHGKPTRSDKNFMYEMAKEGVKIAKPNFTPVDIELPERYATYQLATGFDGRDETLDKIKEYAGDIPLFNLDEINAVRDGKSVSRLMTVQQRAEFHIGPDSGCAWSAIAVGTPVKVFENKGLDSKRTMMHHCALQLMLNNDNVEVIS